MDLNRGKWYVRWYFWSLGICEEFQDNHMIECEVKQDGTNLCAFMRVILIYTPLILLLHAIVYAGALAVITVLPIRLFGLKGYGIGVGAVVTLAVLVFLVINLVMSLKDKRRDARITAQAQMVKATSVDAASPSFIRVLWQWVVAKKQKVCPLITFVKRDEEVQ